MPTDRSEPSAHPTLMHDTLRVSLDSPVALPVSWGWNLRFLTACDHAFLPGAYALINSAFDNDFAGSFQVFGTDDFTVASGVPAPRVTYSPLPRVDPQYHHFVNRLEALVALPPGNYCYLDSDVLIERPSEVIFSAIEDGLLVSTERGDRYEPKDVWLREACRRTNIPVGLPDFPYVNSGILGFQLPRDVDLLRRLCTLSRKLFRGHLSTTIDPFFPHLDQDILNLLVRDRIRDGGAVFVVSPRRVEIGRTDEHHRTRRFPHTRQKDLLPRDQRTYLIHGASLRRPWLDAGRPGWKYRLESSGLLPLRRKFLRTVTPYERAWAYFACAGGQTIPIDLWAAQHRFHAHRHPLWRAVFDL